MHEFCMDPTNLNSGLPHSGLPSNSYRKLLPTKLSSYSLEFLFLTSHIPHLSFLSPLLLCFFFPSTLTAMPFCAHPSALTTMPLGVQSKVFQASQQEKINSCPGQSCIFMFYLSPFLIEDTQYRLL